ncbi:hypothetical protein D3OALGB2SA_314 [Olavius algarvensis associated proteobacterium Delta 3]|nr:hypothetical protein D3OALGB2SA_314 [Olavius algarvensis associated proteobacterium Delta 3]
MYLKVIYPSGRYYAARANDPSIAEWPPHPARLFSAMVASAYRSGIGMTPERRSALEWLEALPAPSIYSPPADLSTAPVNYVPPGDLIKRKGKKGQEEFENPVYRWRQPRHFPSAVILGEPILYYDWNVDTNSEALATLDEIASGVTHLGTSHSMALITAASGRMPTKAYWVPDERGTEFIRTTLPGRLNELDSVFELSGGIRRPVSTCETLTRYRRNFESATTIKSDGTLLIPLRISGTMHGADTAAYLGRALRRAVMSVLGDNCPAAVHGHTKGVHVGWVPLPDVGHRYAKGRVMGIGVSIPASVDMNERAVLLRAIDQIHNLRLPDGRIGQLSSPAPDEVLPAALKIQTWTRPSSEWATVTPVVIDRPPKRLTEDRLRRALRQSLEFAGYPEPKEVTISSFSVFQGAPPAFRVPVKKPRYHATVHFDEPIAGPLLAGRLRFYGVGLFRPLN